MVGEQFDKIVKSGATEYMLVNMSEIRDYVMSARMIADITWDAAKIYAAPGPATRYTAWWSREYFPAAPAAAEAAYNKYFALLDVPGKLWFAEDAIPRLLDALSRKVAGETVPPFDAATLSTLQARMKQLDDALAAESQAEPAMSFAEQRFFATDVALGLRVAERQTAAALKLEEALHAPSAARMWQLVLEARAPLEQLEVELARGEYPPFDHWYGESWIRSANSANNPHRAYAQLRDFIAAEGRAH